MDLNNEIGRRFRRVRDAQGLTRETLSGLLTDAGIPLAVKTIQRVESGERALGASELAQVAAVLGIDPLDLLPVDKSTMVKDSDLYAARSAVRRMRSATDSLRETARLWAAARVEAVEALDVVRDTAQYSSSVASSPLLTEMYGDALVSLGNELGTEARRAAEAAGWVTA